MKGCGLDVHGPKPVLAMEYIPGGTISNLLMKQMSTVGRVYRYSDALRCVLLLLPTMACMQQGRAGAPC